MSKIVCQPHCVVGQSLEQFNGDRANPNHVAEGASFAQSPGPTVGGSEEGNRTRAQHCLLFIFKVGKAHLAVSCSCTPA